jgi:alpha-beta hydrolase superfamily lysophospholipase
VSAEPRAADGVALHVRAWPACGAERARVLLVHGLGEHLGRYEETASALAARGIAVQGCDLRGHGRSGGRRGHVERWSDYHLDLDATCPQPPFAVLAHSMGGCTARACPPAGGRAPARAAAPRALALSGPLLGVAVQLPAWKRAAAGLLSCVAPRLRLANEIPLADLCTDPRVVAAFEADPLREGRSTPRWYAEMHAARRRVAAGLAELIVPAQFHLAGDERIVDAAAIERAAAAWPTAAELLCWPGGRHELLQEPFRAAVQAKIAGFLLAPTGRAA